MKLELMSPAGSFESVMAAARSGADAVYFGAGDFNARRNAKNLTREELETAIRECHLRGVKCYITMNTLLTDRELPAARDLVQQLSALGADALIVQDLGMARVIRAAAPDLPIHASTQLTVHNLAGALAAKELGFSRVVLSRELPFSEIKFICQNAGVEIEVFVHGAMCMCYSGQCFLSAAIGGRSGNRGLCAQPCRLNYAVAGQPMGNPLSLKDMSLASHLRELEEAGVTCIKIEGRMKRPEYTALVTSIYRKALDENRNPTRQELFQLETAFSRDGFSDGYFTGKKGPHMFGMRQESDGKDVRALYKEVRKLYTQEPEPPCVAVDLSFRAKNDENMTLTVSDDEGNSFEATALPAERALNRATTREEVESSLRKTGGTVFYSRNIEVELDEGLRIPAAAINALRRRCLEGLAVQRKRLPDRREGNWQPGVKRLNYNGKPGLIFSFLKAEQMTPALLHRRPDWIWLPLREMTEHLDVVTKLAELGQKFVAVPDRIIWDSQWKTTLERLRVLHKAGFRDVAATNVGQIAVLQKLGFTVHGDFGLNVMNSQTIGELRRMGLASCTLSFEMNLAQVRDLSMGMDCQLIAYGRLPLMITENCVIRHGRTSNCPCGVERSEMTDRTGRSFPLMHEEFCRTTVYNAEKLYLADKLPDLQKLGLRWLRLNFTTENHREAEDIVAAYLGEGDATPQRMTRGLYYRGVQ